MASDTDEQSAPEDPKMWHGAIPKKRYGEHYSTYLRRITPEQEAMIARQARWIGVTPRSIWDSYIPEEPEQQHGET